MPRFINWTAGPGGSLEPYRFPPLFTWDFTQQSPGALVLPTGLSFARASSGHTVQTGTSTLVTSGITSNDVGRIGRLSDSHSRGLFIEPARTNSCRYSRSMNAAPGALSGSVTYTTGRTGPDGTTNAIRGQVASGAFANYDTVPSSGVFASNTQMVFSAWVKKGSGSGAYQFNAAHGGTTGAAAGGIAGANWSRVASATFTYPAGSACYPVGWDGRANTTLSSSAGARDCEIDFAQVEAGKYPTSAIITTGSTATRAAERLTIDSTRSAASIVRGRLAIYLRFRAIAALSSLDYLSEGYLLREVGGNFNVRLYANSQQLEINGPPGYQSITGSSAISIAARDLVEMYFEFGAGKSVARWRINGVRSVATWAVRDDTFPALGSSPSGIDIMNSGGVWQMPGVLELMNTFVPGYF